MHGPAMHQSLKAIEDLQEDEEMKQKALMVDPFYSL
jgi:hypothetical protein